jgi:hypothetical protein
MKKVLQTLAAVAILIALTPIIAALAYTYSIRTVYESVSPSKFGSAIFYQEESFLDTKMDFLVRDYALSGPKPICIEEVSSMSGTPPEKAVWSRDGTVVAVLEDKRWTQVYDFQKHGEGLPPNISGQKKSNAIAALLAKRGGKGQEILSHTYHFNDVARHVWWWEHYQVCW